MHNTLEPHARLNGTALAPKPAGWLFTAFAAAAIIAAAKGSQATEPGKPIELEYVEGDIAGLSSILSEDGKQVIGFIEYRQHLRGDALEVSRIARFTDGSSDEDRVEALVGKTLQSVRGRAIIRDTKGTATVDITIDVAAGRISGFSGLGKARETYDERVKLSPATYWGPLLGIVLKNFDRNAADGRLAFHTVVATPKPRVLDMQFVRKQTSFTTRAGARIGDVRFTLSPTINFLLDPILRMLTPETDFFMSPGDPPALVRFAGPRNYGGQKIRIE